jgi:hypothetical protein
MGYQPAFQSNLYYHHVNFEQRVPQKHILRKAHQKIDLDFTCEEARNTYGENGNV